jgi:hypothetical protein
VDAVFSFASAPLFGMPTFSLLVTIGLLLGGIVFSLWTTRNATKSAVQPVSLQG